MTVRLRYGYHYFKFDINDKIIQPKVQENDEGYYVEFNVNGKKVQQTVQKQGNFYYVDFDLNGKKIQQKSRKHPGHYYVDFYINGKRIQSKIKPKTKSKRIAEKYENDYKNKILKGEIGIDRKNPLLKDMIDQYLEYSKVNKSPNSYRRDKYMLDNFQEVLGLERFSEITPQLAERYKSKRLETVSESTVNTSIVIIKAMINKHIEWGSVDSNPIKSVGKIRGPGGKPVEFLTKEEVNSLLQAATSTYKPIFTTFLRTGLRGKELLYLEWSDIDFSRRQIRILNKEEHKPKGYRERFIPIDDELFKLLRSIPRKFNYVFPTEDGAPRTNNLIRSLKNTGKNAGIEKNLTIHMLRHTYASHLVMNGVDLPTIKELLGHASINTTMIYAHIAPDHLKSAVNKLPF